MASWRKGVTKSDKPDNVTTLAVIPSGPPAPSKHGNPSDSTAVVFFDTCKEFCAACAEVWPKDDVLKTQNERLASVTDKKEEGLRLAKLFHSTFASKYSLVVAKDSTLFNAPEFASVNAASKYASSPEDLRSTVWEYFRALVQYAGMVDMYSKCPQGMLDSISNLAGGLIDKMQNGELDPSKINPLEIGQMMMSSLSMSDIENFGSAIMEGGNMESMMSIMQSTMGAAGMPDMSMLNSMMPMPPK
jgi:hypothetical protein